MTTDGDVCLYQPRSHKTAHPARGKVIMLVRRAREGLRPWLDRDPESYRLVPAETLAWHVRRLRRREHSRDATGDGEARDPNLALGQTYTRHSCRTAVQRACRRAGIPVWSPGHLRHIRATLIRDVWPLEGLNTSPKRSDRPSSPGHRRATRSPTARPPDHDSSLGVLPHQGRCDYTTRSSRT